jgi:hypothetical protein
MLLKERKLKKERHLSQQHQLHLSQLQVTNQRYGVILELAKSVVPHLEQVDLLLVQLHLSQQNQQCQLHLSQQNQQCQLHLSRLRVKILSVVPDQVAKEIHWVVSNQVLVKKILIRLAIINQNPTTCRLGRRRRQNHKI